MAKFLSICPNQVLCMTPNQVQITNGVTMTVSGQHIRFNKGEYETEDKKEIGFIRGHSLFGSRITEVSEPKKKAPEGAAE